MTTKPLPPLDSLMAAFRRGSHARYGHSYGPKGWLSGDNAGWKHKSPGEMASSLKAHRSGEGGHGGGASGATTAHSPRPTQLASAPKESSSTPGRATQLTPASEPAAPATVAPNPKGPDAPPTRQDTAETPSGSFLQKSPDEMAKSLKPQAATPVAPNAAPIDSQAIFSKLPAGKSGYPKAIENAVRRAAPFAKPGSPDYDDALQEGATAVVKAIAEGKFPTDVANPEGWAHRVATNAIMGEGRKKEVRNRGREPLEGGGENVPEKQAKGLIDPLDMDAFRSEIESLDPKSQDIALRAADGQSLSKIADQTGTEQSKVYRILKGLAPIFKEYMQKQATHDKERYAALFESERYEYGPRHQPPKRIDGAVARLAALAEYAGEIDDEALEDEVTGIAREFSAEDLKDIAKKFGIKRGISTKAKTLESLLAKVCEGCE